MAKRFRDPGNPKLSETEREIMQIIWREDHPLTSTFILDQITSRSWTLSTVMTFLARLCKKGFVHCDRSTRTNYYTALISGAEYRERESRDFLEKIHDNSFASMISALNNSGAISEEELTELREFLDENLNR